MLPTALVLIGVTLCATIFLILRLSRISGQISQIESQIAPSSSDEPLSEQIEKSFRVQNKKQKKRDKRLAQYLAKQIVLSMIEYHTRFLRVKHEVAEEPEEESSEMEILEAYWLRELTPRLDELIEVGELYVDKDKLLLTTAKQFLEKNQSYPYPPGPPRSLNQAKEEFLAEVEKVKQRGGEAGVANFSGAAHGEAQDLSYWAVVNSLEFNVRTEEDWKEILSSPKQE